MKGSLRWTYSSQSVDQWKRMIDEAGCSRAQAHPRLQASIISSTQRLTIVFPWLADCDASKPSMPWCLPVDERASQTQLEHTIPHQEKPVSAIKRNIRVNAQQKPYDYTY